MKKMYSIQDVIEHEVELLAENVKNGYWEDDKEYNDEYISNVERELQKLAKSVGVGENEIFIMVFDQEEIEDEEYGLIYVPEIDGMKMVYLCSRGNDIRLII